MSSFFERLWCDWFHGGDIKRDKQDRINWQCRKCGRWSDPVPPEVEAAAVNAALKEKNISQQIKESLK